MKIISFPLTMQNLAFMSVCLISATSEMSLTAALDSLFSGAAIRIFTPRFLICSKTGFRPSTFLIKPWVVVIMTTTQGFIRKVEGLKPVFEQIKKRGVKIRITAPLNKESKTAVKDISDVAEIRHTDMKAKFCIVNGKEIIFMVLNDTEVHPTYDVGIWVNTPFFAGALNGLFDLAWKSLKTAKEVVGK